MPSDRGRLEWVGYSMVETRWSSVWVSRCAGPGAAAALRPTRLEYCAYAAERGLGRSYTEQIVGRSWSMQCDIGRPEVLTEVLRARDERRRFGVALDSGSLPRIPAVASSRDLEIIIVPTLLVDRRRL